MEIRDPNPIDQSIDSGANILISACFDPHAAPIGAVGSELEAEAGLSFARTTKQSRANSTSPSLPGAAWVFLGGGRSGGVAVPSQALWDDLVLD